MAVNSLMGGKLTVFEGSHGEHTQGETQKIVT